LKDTVGITSSALSGGSIGVNWQNVPVQGEVIVGVPEPETYALMLAGLAGMGLAVRRRRAGADKA